MTIIKRPAISDKINQVRPRYKKIIKEPEIITANKRIEERPITLVK
jgi:hypothetical protein